MTQTPHTPDMEGTPTSDGKTRRAGLHPVPTSNNGNGNGNGATVQLPTLMPPPNAPLEVAEHLYTGLFTNPATGVSAIIRAGGSWWLWKKTNWEKQDNPESIRKPIYKALGNSVYEKTRDTKGEPVYAQWQPNKSKVDHVLDALAATAYIPDEKATWGTWAQGAEKLGTWIAAKNGLLNVNGEHIELHPHTPLFRNTHALACDYAPQATCPQWEQFITATFRNDPQQAQLLQEWAGYLISGDTSLQKGLILIGPPGSGKSVIERTLAALLGKQAVAATSMAQLGGRFGLAAIATKSLAVIGDNRARGDKAADAMEPLLNLIGGDLLALERKGKDQVNESAATCRVMIVSNETPRMPDDAGAQLRRWVILKSAPRGDTPPDPHLPKRLASELPGILNWAIEGMIRLQQKQAFTITTTHVEELDELGDLSAPLRMFVEDCLTITGNPNDWIKAEVLQTRYERWHTRNIGSNPRSQRTLLSGLRALGVDGLEAGQFRVDGKRPRGVKGAQLKPLAEFTTAV